ncbi:hypothetical protein QZP91_09095 [Serratia marcescens]|uniref:hypothetical protein n=1 Tax=Serratia marcescens TaxID=615 RepID=UPI00275ACAE2|nr:hypothetical protein [Serratia marcescens]MDP8669623.1 hypothetical protein [Serratia marcescens]MDP8694284.1 hypothetical protein [Serratia marcescens]MDP8723947.1 hypothetical protein [Serratia marcescens]
MRKKQHSHLDSFEFKANTKKTIISNFIILLLGAVLIIVAKNFELPYPWLYTNPSYIDYASLSWISGVWVSILGIHGTIAALSITFMGMFVSQVASSTENSFESVCRVLLLRKEDFLKFSMDAICGLIIGIFYISIGGGLIHYAISISTSIYFIAAYMNMYHKLYSITENKSSINEMLLNELKESGDSYHKLKEESKLLEEKFINSLSTNKNVVIDEDYDYFSHKIIPLNIFKNSSSEIHTIDSFDQNKISALNHHLKSISKNAKLRLKIYFLYPIVNCSAHIIIDKETDLSDDDIAVVSEKTRQCFDIKTKNTSYESFKLLESCVVENIYHTLTTGNEKSLDFGVLALSLLSSKSNHIDIMTQLDLTISSSERRSYIEDSMLESLFKKLYNMKFGGDTIDNNIFVINSIINISMYSYEREKYEAFFKKINRMIESRVQYGDNDVSNPYLGYYNNLTIRHLSKRYYTAFGENTHHLTRNLKYLSTRGDDNKLNNRQEKLIICMRECVALLILRLTFISSKTIQATYKEEEKTLSQLLIKWLNPSFIEDVYFNQEFYEILFNVPSDFSTFDAEQKLTEIPDGVVARLRTSYNFYYAIAIILYSSTENNNHLGLFFIRDKKEFIRKAKVTTHMIESIIEYVRSPKFSDTVKTIWDNKEPVDAITGKAEKLANSLEEIKSEVTKYVTNEVENSKLDNELIDQYKKEITDSVVIEIGKIINIEKAELTEKEKNQPDYISLIDKREVLAPIDGVHYSMNSKNHALRAVYEFIKSAINCIKKGKVSIKEIDDTEVLEGGRYITIEYKVEDPKNTYKFSKGLRMHDKKGLLGFGRSGIYYLNLEKELSIKLNRKDISSTEIVAINEGNSTSIYKKFDIKKDEDNLLLRSEIKIAINMFFDRNKETTLLFLSEERCKELNENQEKQYQQLLLKMNPDSNNNNV